ncbi:unnamed protein product [Ectocarpus fasciculatus]
MSSDDGTEMFGIIFFWMFGGLFVNCFLLIACSSPFGVFTRVFNYCDRCRWSYSCLFLQGIAICIVCSCLGPLPLAFLLCRFLWRFLSHLCRFCVDLPRQAARRKTQLAVDRLRRFPGQTTWQARGWLIMMRARHQRSLARSTGWRARLWKLERYDEASIIKYAMKDVMTGQTSPEIELLEAGRLKMNFVRTVMAVVEIEEPGLFRHIITYL